MRPVLVATAIALPLTAAPALAADIIPSSDPIVSHSPAPRSDSGFYAALRGGFTSFDDTEFDVGALGIDSVQNEYDDFDLFGSVAGGYRFGGFRVEGEVGYFAADIETHGAVAAGAADTDFPADESFGDVDVVTFMLNAYYDLDLGAVSPFVGGGVGVGIVSANGFGVDALDGALPDGVALDDEDTGFAWQVTAGLGFDVTDTVAAEIGYRYQRVDAELASVTEAERDFDIEAHTGFLGLRVNF